MKLRLVVLGMLVACAPALADPATAPAQKHEKAEHGDKLITTEHQLKAGEQTIKYKATAGTLSMKDEAGKAKADMFFVAYERQGDDGKPLDAAKRPVTYVFNGGPGAAAVWLHLGAVGPQRVNLTEEGRVPPPPYRAVDNVSTWLDATDLVFIDPVGTGFSRAAAGEDPKQFYGVEEDVRSVGEFIRLWTTRNNRWPSPKFLAGESYGTTRAAALSNYLLDSQGIALNGIVFVSTVLSFQGISFDAGNDLPYTLFLPTYTATAWYHKKLSSEMQADLSRTLKDAERFALGEYAAALAKGNSLVGDERAATVKKVSQFTGLPADVVEKADLRIDASLFRKTLLGNSRVGLGRFDARVTGYDPDPFSRGPDFDPSLTEYLAAYTGAFNQYVRKDLGFESDLQYELLTGRVHPWNFGRAGNGYLNVADDLSRAMRKNPHMKIMFASGVFDLATPYLSEMYTANHLELNPTLRKNVTEQFYMGGHMMYHHRPSLEKLHEDVRQFIGAAGASAEPASPAKP